MTNITSIKFQNIGANPNMQWSAKATVPQEGFMTTIVQSDRIRAGAEAAKAGIHLPREAGRHFSGAPDVPVTDSTDGKTSKGPHACEWDEWRPIRDC